MTSTKVSGMFLTKEQKECVNYNAGDLLIRGVAGSGKSYVILKRAVKLFKAKEDEESVAIFTFTNSLVKYTDDLIRAKLGEGQIEVLTVDSYCMGVYRQISRRRFNVGSTDDYRRIIRETLEQHKKSSNLNHRFYDMNVEFFEEEFRWIREKCIKSKEGYVQVDRKGRGSQTRLSAKDKELLWSIYSQFMKNAKESRFQDWPDLYMYLNDNLNRIPESKKIDYVLLDEAQDMTVGKLRVLKALSKKSLTIAADVAQKIYKTSFTWKEVGIDISGRSSKALSKSFRSTKQIVELAEDLMAKNRKGAGANGEYTAAVLPEVKGDKPRIVRCKSTIDENSYLINLVKTYSQAKDEVIGIICRTDNEIKDIKKLLFRNGLRYEIVTNQKKENASWSLLRPGIKLVKAHSSKGLEFDRVVIPYVDDSIYPLKTFKVDEDQLEETLKTERNILYVAMTRARTTLVILCINSAASRFIDEFDSEHYEVVNI